MSSDVRETVDSDSEIQKSMDEEDSEPRIARIRENLVDGLGPFDLMADIIVGSQHGPNNSGLFGVVQSPIRPLRPSFVPTSSTSSAPESHLTASQMAQRMQNIVDVPLATIHTNLPFKKNQERKNNSTKGSEPAASSANFVNTSSGNSMTSTTSSRTDDNSCRKRKRRRSDCNNTDTENWQKPCTSNTTAKVECGDRMMINELFGEEKLENGNTKKRTIDMLKNMEKKIVKWEKEEQESPDSGFADEINDQNREQFHRPRLQTIIGELGHISPLLTPPRQPQKSDGPTLPVIINLDRLDSSQLLRIKNVFIKNAPVFLSTVALPSCVLSPPVRPTSRNERDGTSQLCDSDFKLVPSSTTIDSNGSSVASCKKQIIHSAGATPSSSSTKDFKKHCYSTSSDDRKHELAVLKNDDLKITLIKKFVKQCDKAYVTTSTTSSIKENEKRKRKDSSAPPNSCNEQSPSTSKPGKKSAQLKFASHVPSSKPDDLKGKDKKEGLDNEHSREKEKFTTSRSKDCSGLNDQLGDSTGIAQVRELKKKVNDAAVSIANNNSSQVDNTRVKVAKSSKCKDSEVSLVKKCKKDACSGNKLADGMQEISGDFVCCKSRTAPTKKTVLEKNHDGTYKSANYYLDEVARPLKHRADKESGDHIRKTLAYMDAAVYFILSSATERENRQRQYTIARDSAELMKTIIKWSGASAASLSSLERHFISRFRILSFRVQAVLNYYLYSLKMGSCMSNFGALTKWEPQLTELDAAAMRNDGAASVSSQGGSSANTETPSPASSTNSGHGERQKEINVPVSIYQAQRSQLSILHHLMWSDRLWKQTLGKMNSPEQEMVKHLDQICGPLTVDLSLHSLSEYLATAVTWLRAEYRAEKERLSPSSFSQQQL
uniref:AF4/FMR2 family member lilli n=1 Tax=Elaeophora elaphi TaxID=1147741 RepID=A0A0R3RJP5_9BILA